MVRSNPTARPSSTCSRTTGSGSRRFFGNAEGPADHIAGKAARLQEARATRSLPRSNGGVPILSRKDGSRALQIRFLRIRRKPRRRFRLYALRDEFATDPEGSKLARELVR